MSHRQSAGVAFAALLALSWCGASIAQTVAGPPNGYTPQDDVEIGLRAAALVEREIPVLHDEAVTRYLAAVVQRLVAALPSELQHPEFHYVVQVIDVREVNARALPGGPIYVDRGLFESARTTGELAGVIARRRVNRCAELRKAPWITRLVFGSTTRRRSSCPPRRIASPPRPSNPRSGRTRDIRIDRVPDARRPAKRRRREEIRGTLRPASRSVLRRGHQPDRTTRRAPDLRTG